MMDIKTKICRHGTFCFFVGDNCVGRSLELYGEYNEAEIAGLALCLRPDDVVIEVGSNVGAITVPMARMANKVYAYEQQTSLAALLRRNIAHNSIDNVIVMQSELIDTLQLQRLDFIKLDCEGNERDVLLGAEKTIERTRPIIYCRNDRQETSADLIGALVDLGYRLYWHRPLLWSPDNFNNNPRNIFGAAVSQNMLCVPSERKIEVRHLEEIADLRVSADMHEREMHRFEKEMERQPDDLTARLLVAHYANLTGDRDRAESLIAENLKRDPDHIPTRSISGLIDLQNGRYTSGWRDYELRHVQKDKQHILARFSGIPKWDGQQTNEPVLIWSEQGYGDSIMFVRFVEYALALAPNAFIDVQPQLAELFELSYPCPVFRQRRSMPDYSMHCSMASLPFILGLHSEQQLRAAPYLEADPTMVSAWQKKLHGTSKIGMCWKGSPRSERPYSRDIPEALIKPIMFDQAPVLSLVQEGQFESFADTAAAIAALDLVISVDTSVAHLAGAMGKECWLLLSSDPDWRWGLHGDRTCWYDSVRIFRQREFLQWQPVIDAVHAALAERDLQQMAA